MGALDEYRTILYPDPEITALKLGRADKLGTIEGAWTRDAIDLLDATLPNKFADVRFELAESFARRPRAERRRAST